MTLPSTSSNQPLHTGVSRLALVTTLTASLLGGCSVFSSSGTQSVEPAAAAPAPALADKPVAAAVPAAEPLVPLVRSVVATPIAEPVKLEATPARNTPEAVAPAPAPTKAAAPAMPGVLVPGFYLNVGLFAVPGNGTNAFKKLEAAQLPVFSDPIVRKKVTLTRVRVGPFATKALADAAAQKIHALKLEAVVFKH